jgi:hypothetical protein
MSKVDYLFFENPASAHDRIENRTLLREKERTKHALYNNEKNIQSERRWKKTSSLEKYYFSNRHFVKLQHGPFGAGKFIISFSPFGRTAILVTVNIFRNILSIRNGRFNPRSAFCYTYRTAEKIFYWHFTRFLLAITQMRRFCATLLACRGRTLSTISRVSCRILVETLMKKNISIRIITQL